MFESNVTEGGQIMQSVKVTFCNMKMLLQHCKKKEKKKKIKFPRRAQSNIALHVHKISHSGALAIGITFQLLYLKHN